MIALPQEGVPVERSDEQVAAMDPDANPFADAASAGGDEFMAVKPWVGAIKAPSNVSRRATHGPTKAPSARLDLVHVHGYQGQTVRGNVRYDHKGDVLYHAAALGISQNPRTHEQRFAFHNTDDIIRYDDERERVMRT
jgi:hypothetical protein